MHAHLQRAESAEEKATRIMLHGLRSKLAKGGVLSTEGSRVSALKSRAEAIAWGLFDEELSKQRLVEAASRVTGLSRKLWGVAVEMKQQDLDPSSQMAADLTRAPRIDKQDLDWVVSWFHTNSPDVEPDKSLKRTYKGAWKVVGEKKVRLYCTKKLLMCSRVDAIRHFHESPEYREHVSSGGSPIDALRVAGCICACIKDATRNECACPVCTDMEEMLDAWESGREEMHRSEPCECPLRCKDPASPWRQASRSGCHLRSNTSCARVPHEGLELPHLPESPPELYCLQCALPSKGSGKHPLHESHPCPRCGWGALFESHDSIARCPVEYNSRKKVTANLRQEVDNGKGGTVKRWVPVELTRSELLRKIEAALPDYKYHLWLNAWLKWQFKLDIATFDRATEIVVLTDYAAVYEAKGRHVQTAEHGVCCTELVALVLHSPEPLPADHTGKEREVVCDYWRIWINQKGDAAAHHVAMEDIRRHYKAGSVPGLQRMKVYSDGQRAQYKGRKNFGRMAQWPGKFGCELWHTTFESHHGSGPHDNAGKDPRRMMDAAIKNKEVGAQAIYSHYDCYTWCLAHYAAPSSRHEHPGTWGCNGVFVWRCYASMDYDNPHSLPPIDTRPDFTHIEHSNDLFSFRCKHKTEPEVECWFLPCFCAGCRANHRAAFATAPPEPNCSFLHYTKQPTWEYSRQVAAPTRRITRRRRADDEDDEDYGP